MVLLSSNKKFNIQMPQALYNGEDLRYQIQYVNIYLIEGNEVTVYDLCMVIKDCFISYEEDYKDWAPEIHAFIHINDKRFKLVARWEEQVWDYIFQLSTQIKL